MKVESSLPSSPHRPHLDRSPSLSIEATASSDFEDVVDENTQTLVRTANPRNLKNPEVTACTTQAVTTKAAATEKQNPTTSPQRSALPPLRPAPSPSRSTNSRSIHSNMRPGPSSQLGVETRSALTPRTDDQTNQVSSPVSSNTASSIQKNVIVPDKSARIVGESRRGTGVRVVTKRTTASTPPRPPPQPDGSHGRSRVSDDSIRRRNVREMMSPSDSPRKSTISGEKALPNKSISPSPSNAGPRPEWQWNQKSDPEAQEQALFEQRLCEDVYGVAVRKINQNGKSSLRYIKCIPVEGTDADDNQSTSRSVSSLVRSFSRRPNNKRESDASPGTPQRNTALASGSKRRRALTWGKKKDHILTLDQFLCVRKGKTTERTRKSSQPGSRLLSLITTDRSNPCLDIEAPTRMDRDKFARAFARFLQVPLESDHALGEKRGQHLSSCE